MNSKIIRKPWIPYVLLILLGVIVWVNTLQNTLLWDDDDNITNNVYIKNFRYLPKLFTENQIAGAGFKSNQYRPILLLTYSIEYHLVKANPILYHTTNVVLHITNVVLTYIIVKSLLQKKKDLEKIGIALITSVVFLIHPIQTEAVNYVAGRTDLLGTLWMLLGILVFLSKKTHIALKITLVSILYICGVLSKESAIILPGLIAITYIYKRTTQNQKNNLRDDAYAMFVEFAVLLIATVYTVFRLTTLNFLNTLNVYGYENMLTESVLVRIYTFLSTLPIYLSLILFPLHLHVERVLNPSLSPADPLSLLGIGIVCISIFTIIWCRKRDPIVSYGIAWFYIAIFPVSNIPFPVNAIVTEHWLYTPSIGICIVIAVICIKIFEKIQKFRYALFVLGLVIFAFLCTRSIVRNQDWRNAISLYEHTLKYNPKSARVHNNLAMAYDQNGKLEKALFHYNEALKISDQYPQVHHNIANIYKNQNKEIQAIEEYKKAIKMDQSFLFSYKPLIELLEKNKLDEEKEHYLNIWAQTQSQYR